MLWDTITNQWFWFSAAGVFAVLTGIFGVYSFYKRGAYSFYKPKPYDVIHDQQNGWTPTGRIDFLDSGSSKFVLQAEDTRIVNSMSGVEHRQIRWRKATLDEAKAVVVAYHARLNLTMTGSFIVSSTNG